jgi:hypothetical protein
VPLDSEAQRKYEEAISAEDFKEWLEYVNENAEYRPASIGSILSTLYTKSYVNDFSSFRTGYPEALAERLSQLFAKCTNSPDRITPIADITPSQVAAELENDNILLLVDDSGGSVALDRIITVYFYDGTYLYYNDGTDGSIHTCLLKDIIPLHAISIGYSK